MRIISWNVNGLRAIHKKGFLEWLQKEQPDILCLQETKADVESLPQDLREVGGYNAFFNSAEKKGYSGVCVYSRSKPVRVEKSFGAKKFDPEGRVLVLEYPKFVLCNVYFPNGKASAERLKYKMDFYDAFLKFVDKLHAEGKKVVICGDVNTAHKEIDLARPKENSETSGFLPEERVWIDELLAHDFVDSFRKFHSEPDNYSWWDYKTKARERNVGWRIDYFFTSKSLKLKDAFIMNEVLGSDHCPVGIEL